MVEQAQQQKSFLDIVVERTGLRTTNEAQGAANAVFRILRDLLSNRETNKIEADLRDRAPEAEQEVVDLWKDLNVMVAFFSRISPIQDLHLRSSTFLLRLKEEGYLPEDVSAENVAKGVFSATKELLSQERSQAIAQSLPTEIRQLWEQA